jgi:hypothetical protein
VSPGDVAVAVNGLRVLYDYLVATRASGDANLSTADAQTEEA